MWILVAFLTQRAKNIHVKIAVNINIRTLSQTSEKVLPEAPVQYSDILVNYSTAQVLGFGLKPVYTAY